MNYDKYRLSAREYIICLGKFILISITFSYLFYDSFGMILLSSPLCILYLKREKNNKLIYRKEQLKKEFLKAILSVSASLSAGLSVDNAFREAAVDMQRLFGKRECIVLELNSLCRKVSCGIRIEDALNDFAVRSGVDTIRDFALIFACAKESGGNLRNVIAKCVDILENEQKTKDEIKVLLRQKQLEQRIMSIIPLGIILYLRVSSGNFLNILYHNTCGRLVMSGCLGVYLVSIYLSERICRISV